MNPQPDLFTEPSGPPSPIPSAKAGMYGRYLQWRDTDDGQLVFAQCAMMALAALRHGETRVSMKGLCEAVRHLHRVKINNIHVAWIGDSLIVSYPELDRVIERRARTKAKTL